MNNPYYNPWPRMLVVDDLPLNIRHLDELFHDEFEIYMATGGVQALNRAREVLPDIILLDVEMPEMDGFEVCQHLKADPSTASIPVIFITASYDEEDEVKGFMLGGADFIHKPINPTITRARVHTHLALKQQADQLRDIALLDGLTGVANRRRFDQELAVLWRQCLRNRTPLSLVMLDVDYFKRYNDRYGHQMGDSCLQQVADTLKRSLQRPQDLVARYGGEEFICILPETDFAGACHMAGQLQRGIESLGLAHASSDVSHVVTASIGVVTQIPELTSNTDALVEQADQQLYRAKQEGRARICALDLSNSTSAGN